MVVQGHREISACEMTLKDIGKTKVKLKVKFLKIFTYFFTQYMAMAAYF